MYNRLLEWFSDRYGKGFAKKVLEDEIKRLMRSLSINRKEAIKKLYKDIVSPPSTGYRILRIGDIKVELRYDGDGFGIIYVGT